MCPFFRRRFVQTTLSLLRRLIAKPDPDDAKRTVRILYDKYDPELLNKARDPKARGKSLLYYGPLAGRPFSDPELP